jgi:hypothetical protein
MAANGDVISFACCKRIFLMALCHRERQRKVTKKFAVDQLTTPNETVGSMT